MNKKEKDGESQPWIKIKRSVVYNPNATELSDVEDEIPKEEYFLKIKDILNKLSEKFNKSEEELTEAYVSVSGDIEELTKLLEGKRVTQWTYLDDLALGKQRDSEEFKAILYDKGKDEINKRMLFLIQAQGDDCEEE